MSQRKFAEQIAQLSQEAQDVQTALQKRTSAPERAALRARLTSIVRSLRWYQARTRGNPPRRLGPGPRQRVEAGAL